MATIAVGDIQGCFDELQELLSVMKFDPTQDQLWSVGDLVNRGPKSLEVLRFFMSLPRAPIITLGNHDLHFLAVALGAEPVRPQDTFQDCLASPDLPSIIEWLRRQPLVHDDPELSCTMVHAGIPPQWNLQDALQYSAELSALLQSDQAFAFLKNMYGNQPCQWNHALTGHDRYRALTNYFTRMRFCDATGKLELQSKESSTLEDPNWKPWFTWPRTPLARTIIFGHWAALEGRTNQENFQALDTGCVWGNHLTALNLDTRKRYQVKSHQPITR